MEHYYSEKQTSSLKLGLINVNILGNAFELYTSSGIFSREKVDKGTEALIKNAVIKDGWEILDLGCGYGIVGISILKKYPNCRLTMADVNERAVMLAKKNLKHNNLEANVFQSNIYSKIAGKFDTILTNPPQRAGKDVCFKIIEQAKNHLNKEGLLQLVCRRNKGGRQLSEKMKEVFGNLEVTAKKSGYWVYVSQLFNKP